MNSNSTFQLTQVWNEFRRNTKPVLLKSHRVDPQRLHAGSLPYITIRPPPDLRGKRKMSNIQSKVAVAFKAPSPTHLSEIQSTIIPVVKEEWTQLKYGSKQPWHSDFYYTLDNLVKKVEHYKGFF